MPRLVPNPIGELLQPLLRLEGAIAKLTGELRPVNTLPAVHRELAEVNVTLAAIHETLRGLREDAAGSHDGAPRAPRRPRSGG